MSLQTVINQNQQTIAFLEAKDYYSALVSASSALHSLDSVPVPTQQEQHDEGNRMLPHVRSSSSSPESSIDQCMLHFNIQEDDRTCGTQTFMYSHAIPLPPNVTDYAIIASILIFNTALAHHLVALLLLDKERSPQYLHRAKQLYTLAYNSSQEDIEHNPLFLFVVYNNTALANLQIGDKDLRNSCVGYLVSIYVVMVDKGYISRLRHLQGFLESLVASMPTAAAA
ncbi:unnamed protein product [Cylindrotheca closterium]|uniref:Uncharacterized protein n=1 Tax=Cylindrotheca closterium TaxID=2856 RepID=A0AAD2CK29_9STRA|nr:unnamed protein product [Cylindrotheca closterium]